MATHSRLEDPRSLSVGKSGQRGGACHRHDVKYDYAPISLKGSQVQLLISSCVFADMAVELAIFMKCFIAGRLLLHLPLQVTGPDSLIHSLLQTSSHFCSELFPRQQFLWQLRPQQL